MRIILPAHLSAQALADRCDVHIASMYRALNKFDESGVHVCSPELAERIHRESNGAIPCWVLRPDLWAEGQVPPGLMNLQATA